MSPALALRVGYAAANRAVSPDHPSLDDLAQEAAWAALRASEKHPYAGATVARRRVLDLLAGKPYTGEEVKQGNVRDPLRQAATASLEAMAGEDESSWALVHEDPALEAAEWSSLRPRIDRAIRTIPASNDTPARVARLVGLGESASGAGRALGMSAEGGRWAWRKARESLKRSLVDLAGEVRS